MQATQLLLDFTTISAPIAKSILKNPAWRNVTDIARGAGFLCACEISPELSDHLSDQDMYDVLWTARHTLLLDREHIAQFTLDLDGKPVHFKAQQIDRVVRLGRAIDF